MLTDEEIKKLWQDPKYHAAFSGVLNFRAFLKLDYNEVRKMLYLFLHRYFAKYFWVGIVQCWHTYRGAVAKWSKAPLIKQKLFL